MNFYQSLGFLVFGSRLKRLSEMFLNDVNEIYKKHKIPFDACWFPVFYILSEKREVTIRDISVSLKISHSAASQLITGLHQKGLIKCTASKTDARKKTVAFTAKGEKLLHKIQAVWDALQKAMEKLSSEGKNSKKVLDALTEIEINLKKENLYQRIESNLK